MLLVAWCPLLVTARDAAGARRDAATSGDKQPARSLAP